MKANISCTVSHCLNYSNYLSATHIPTFTEVFKYFNSPIQYFFFK